MLPLSIPLLASLGARPALPFQGPQLGRKLNGEITALAPTLDGQVTRHALVPDGRRVLFVAEQSFGSSASELFVAELDGGGDPLRLSTSPFLPLGAPVASDPSGTRAVFNADVLSSVLLDGSAAPTPLSPAKAQSFRFTGDGTQVVFVADPERPAHFELDRVALDGSVPAVRLSATLAAGGDVSAFQLTAQRAVYLADQEEDERKELYQVPLDGSQAPLKLNGPLVAGGDVGGLNHAEAFAISPDGQRVVYLADQLVDEQIELFSVPSAGGPALALSGSLVANADVRSFRIDATGTRVVYLADARERGKVELFSAPIDGSAAPIVLNGALVTNGDVKEFQLTPDGARVLYLADQDVDEVSELFSVPIGGGASAVQINDALTNGGDVDFVALTATRVVYRADQRLNEIFDLYSAAVDGSGRPARLYQGILNGALLQPAPVLGPDGGSVVFYAEPQAFFGPELLSAPLDGSAPAHPLEMYLLAPVQLAVAPDGARAVYIASSRGAPPRSADLYSVPLDGSHASTMLNQVSAPAGEIGPFTLTADGASAVYLATQESPRDELFATRTAAGSVNDKLSEVQPYGVSEFRTTPDGARALYRHGTVLYSVPVDGSAPPARVSTTSEGAFDPYAFLPDSSRVVYVSNLFSTGGLALRRGQADGSGTPVTLTDSYYPYPTMRLALTPDGASAVFIAPPVQGAGIEVYRVSTTRRGEVRLSPGTHRPNADLRALTIDPTGRRALYVVDAEVTARFELYSVPLDASAPAVRLNPSLRTGESVGIYTEPSQARYFHEAPFMIAPDGRSVVFVVNRLRGHAFHLFRAPLDGSAPAQRLAEWPWVIEPSSPSSQGAFAVDPLSRRVVYQTGDHGRLFSVPLDGSKAPRELGDATAALGGVPARDGETAFRISADGQRVVYLADQERRERFELYSVPLDGSGPALRVSDALQLNGAVQSFALEGAHLVYLADQERDEVFELYRAPWLGPGASTKLNPPLVSGGDVLRFQTYPGRVLYQADQDADEVFELYLSTLPKLAR